MSLETGATMTLSRTWFRPVAAAVVVAFAVQFLDQNDDGKLAAEDGNFLRIARVLSRA